MSTNGRYTYKLEKVSVCKTSHHREVGNENENPTTVGLGIMHIILSFFAVSADHRLVRIRIYSSVR